MLPEHEILMQITNVPNWVALAVVAGMVLVFFAVAGRDFSLWIQSVMTHAGVGFVEIVTMRFRKVDARVIVICKIQLLKAGGDDVSTNALEMMFLAGGDVSRITKALIAAKRQGVDLDWARALKVDLAGRCIYAEFGLREDEIDFEGLRQADLRIQQARR